MGLEVKDLTVAYGRRTVFEKLSFQAREGEVLALMGVNGAGKTTLLKAVSGIGKALSGSSRLNERDLFRMTYRERAKEAAYVPQHTKAAMGISGADAVMMGRIPFMKRKPSEKDREQVFGILEQLSLEAFAFRPLDQLSGGERQQILIARALVQEPRLLLLDEPTSSMDLKNQLKVLGLIREVTREKGLVTIVSIHDLNLAAMFCDRFLMMKDGGIYRSGRAEEVLTESCIREVYGVEAEVWETEPRRILLRDPEQNIPLSVPFQ